MDKKSSPTVTKRHLSFENRDSKIYLLLFQAALNVHKKQETIIAESLLLRIRELQDAGAEINIQTVQCPSDDIYRLRDR